MNNMQEYSRCLVPSLEVRGKKGESRESKEKRGEKWRETELRQR